MDLEGVSRHDASAVRDKEREAAVVVPVLNRPEPHLLFTKRSDHLSDHPGQMSFPGGGAEPFDDGLSATALREAREEICLSPSEADFVGRLDDIQTVTRYSVRPYVVRIPDREYEPCDEEVAEIAIMPVEALIDLDNHYSERRDHGDYGEIRLHYFYVDDYTVWGATARILVQFLELATEWEIPDEADRVVDPDADFPV